MTNGLRPTVGHLDPASPQAEWWSRITGSLDVPLKAPVPVPARLEEGEEPQLVYLVDVERLPEKQLEAICSVMAAKFGVPIDEVRAGIRGEHGLPIREDQMTTITFDGRLFL